MKKIKFLSMILCLSCFANEVLAATEITPKGKVTSTQGHIAPSCRTVEFKENASGNVRQFRIPDNTTQDNGIASIALSALIANRDVVIIYDPAVTSGCGTEPRISYIAIY